MNYGTHLFAPLDQSWNQDPDLSNEKMQREEREVEKIFWVY